MKYFRSASVSEYRS